MHHKMLQSYYFVDFLCHQMFKEIYLLPLATKYKEGTNFPDDSRK